MGTAAFNQFTTATTDITKIIVQGQADLLGIFATSAKGTPAAPLFDAAVQMQRSALENLNAVAGTISKKAPKSPEKATTKVVKKAAKAQAEIVVGAAEKTVAVTTKAKDTLEKAVKSSPKIDVAELQDDLTAVTGIGPSTMKKLQAEGIRTIADLASTSSKDLAEIIEKANVRLLKYTPADWISDAKKLLKSSKAV